MEQYISFANQACDYLTNSPDPFYAVQNNVDKLHQAGYIQLSKRKPFANIIQPGGKYYYTVNKSTLVAFAVGPQYKPGNGFKVVAGHTGMNWCELERDNQTSQLDLRDHYTQCT